VRCKNPAVDMVALKEHWRQWSGIVAQFAKRRDAQPSIQHGEYLALHNALVQECQTLATQSDAAQEAFFLEAKGIVKPWLTPQSLAQAESHVVIRLAQQCRTIERTLVGRRFALRGRLRRITVVAIALAAVAFVLMSWSVDSIDSLLQASRVAIGRFGYFLRHTTSTQRLFAIAVAVVVVAIYFVRTSARKY